MNDLRQLDLEQLTQLFKEWGQPAYRARQVEEWLWQKSARSIDEMSNLPKDLRQKLSAEYEIRPLSIASTQRSSDGTIKYGFKLHDGYMVEGVLIPTKSRVTACISSQVGCSLSCTFCATGFLKRERNLRFDEIYDQVAILRKEAVEHYGRNLSNVVLMGMGEPLLNYAQVLKGVNLITSEQGLNISPQRFTLSTAGIAKMIKKLGDDQVRFNLALSLHAATNEKRSKIMPINDSNPLEDLIEALNYFYEKTNTRITLEYCVINDINDAPDEAEDLVRFARQVPCKVNLIEYNPIDQAQYESSPVEKLERFRDYLERNKIIVNIRRSRGKDIDAACGQLANKSLNV